MASEKMIIARPPFRDDRIQLELRYLYAAFFGTLCLTWVLWGCSGFSDHITLKEILKSGQLTVITRNNSHCYYLYRDEPMGFEYELAKSFADYLGVKLKLKIAQTWEDMIPLLIKGQGALIAASITVTPQRKKLLAFSDAYMRIQQYLITHQEYSNVDRIEELSGRKIYVRRGSPYQERLQELIREGYKIKLKLIDNISTEELIRRVAQGQIDFTVANNNVFLINHRYYPRAVLTVPINKKQYLAWAVDPRSTALLAKINNFFRSLRASGQFAEIYNRYYDNVKQFDFVDLRTYHRRLESHLPKYETLIKVSARKHSFDWRLIAAQIYQESHFDVEAESHAGAYGLMQLTRSTAKSLGVNDLYDPWQNIPAGVKHLKWLYDRFPLAQPEDRLYLSLAAYNIGIGHVRDARRLALKMRLDPNKWSSLKKTLPLLKSRRYYKQSQYGFCQGNEPVGYVDQIMIYYDILKRRAVEKGLPQHRTHWGLPQYGG